MCMDRLDLDRGAGSRASLSPQSLPHAYSYGEPRCLNASSGLSRSQELGVSRCCFISRQRYFSKPA